MNPLNPTFHGPFVLAYLADQISSKARELRDINVLEEKTFLQLRRNLIEETRYALQIDDAGRFASTEYQGFFQNLSDKDRGKLVESHQFILIATNRTPQWAQCAVEEHGRKIRNIALLNMTRPSCFTWPKSYLSLHQPPKKKGPLTTEDLRN